VSAESSITSGVTRAPLRLAPMLMLGGWLVLVDVWVKAVARLGACPGADAGPWTTPGACGQVVLAGDLVLVPAVRDGLPGIPLADPLMRQLGALVVIAVVTIATIVVMRARSRQSADLLALGCVWAGAVSWTAPILVGPGVGFTELVAAGVAFGIGDVAGVAGVVWLVVERARA
jgi:hypothetical protein